MVNKANLIVKIAELVKTKKIDGITDIRDESNREGVRVVIELRRDVNANVILNQLYKHTQLQDTFGVIMLALVNNEPRVMSLLDMLTYYLKHQEDVVTRRTKYDLNKAEERDHILQGLLKALDFIDEVISIIRSSQNTQIAKERLIERFELSDVQAQAIVDMRLRALTGLEREKLENEHKELEIRIGELKAILADEKLLLGVIKEEIMMIAEKYGDDRRSTIGFDEFDISMEDMIPYENTIITMTHLGYIKRMTVDNFKSQHRGGKGIKGMQTIEDDYIEDLLLSTTHHYMNFFTNMGRVYRLKAYEIPEASRTARGTAVINLLQLQPGEKITAMIPIKEYDDDKSLFMVTKKGIVKKTVLSEYANVRKNGLTAINLRDDDELIEVKITDNESETLLIVSENGLGKRTYTKEFNVQKRGGKGVKCYKITEKTGDVIGVKAVKDEYELMMITTEGVVIQLPIHDVSILGRITSGVKMMNLDKGVKIAQIAKVRDRVESNGQEEIDLDDDEESENSETANMADDTETAETKETQETEETDNIEET